MRKATSLGVIKAIAAETEAVQRIEVGMIEDDDVEAFQGTKGEMGRERDCIDHVLQESMETKNRGIAQDHQQESGPNRPGQRRNIGFAKNLNQNPHPTMIQIH